MIRVKALILTGIIIFACVSVVAYQNKQDNSQLTLPNPQNNTISENKTITKNDNASKTNLETQSSSNNNQNENSKVESKSDIENSDSQSIAQRYIEEPDAVAGKPERYNIGGKSTDVVPVIQNGERVGEIHIDPETGENVGGAGGAP